MTIDWRVLAFATALALGGSVLFGLLPALRAARPDLASALRGQLIRGTLARRLTLRGTLVVLQVAGSLVLLVGSGLFLRSALAMSRTDPGFDVTGVAVTSFTIRDATVTEDDLRQAVLTMRDRIASHPEVSEVHVSSVPEASAFQDASRATIEIAGTPPTAGESRVVSFSAVTPGYFEMLGVRPLRGRTLEPTDRLGAPPVALVNQAFARRYWPDVDPVGRRFTVLQKRVFDAHSPDVGGRTFEVVGILPNVQVQPEEAPAPFFWTSYLQDATRLVVFHARGHGDAEDLVPILREEVAATADDVLLVPPRTYEGLMAFLYLPQRIASQLLGFAGGFALLLAVMGIYGMVSFAVSERRHEMAIRQAIGAHRGTIFGTVVWGGLRLAATGIVLGMLFAVPSALLMRSGLHGVGPLDPAALSGSALVLLLSAAAATLVPARRATGVDPMTVLREE